VFMVAYFALLLLCGLGVFLGMQAGSAILLAVVILGGIVALLVMAALQATMQGVYSAALYRYATNSGAQTPGFGPELMQQAFKVKA
jgi:hypothetical protein